MAIYQGNKELTLNNVSTVKHGGVTVYLHKYTIDAPFMNYLEGWIFLDKITNITRGHKIMYIQPSYQTQSGHKVEIWNLISNTSIDAPDVRLQDNMLAIIQNGYGLTQNATFKIWFD